MIDEPGHARCVATMSMNIDTCTHCGQRRAKNAVALAQNDEVLGSLVDFEVDGTEKWHYNLKTQHHRTAIMSALTATVREDHTKWGCSERVGHNDRHEPLFCREIMKMSERVCKNCWCIRRVGAAALSEDRKYLGLLDSITQGAVEWWDYLPEIDEN
ncbi:hypothetical protein FPHYL_830 [Fusarium phyllophilum]|uniref:Uncharacterized protein n=1 Tax=Fusarium phyllophilum TaxID=47803 RepID=A0A8H5KFD2_9HYPO|nr:hypothetical protein FPHYL_830 [Fusarium phyllophilum]